ncbi:proton myo-inositol cotransporter [Elysia marginata]|uniref:Proton myo-inositol cotransporter n=1 Tax=Elysia marginata TaxID=1093978 RepID=A0AAV4H959_9GAST|nr:proton myo-inositol cotransporter [Elysia marginata]
MEGGELLQEMSTQDTSLAVDQMAPQPQPDRAISSSVVDQNQPSLDISPGEDVPGDSTKAHSGKLAVPDEGGESPTAKKTPKPDSSPSEILDPVPRVAFLEVEKKPTNEMATARFVYVLSALATIGGFLFGYDIGIVAGSMLFIQPYFELSTFWQEAIVSGTVGAAAVAALMAGWLTDRVGRKPTVMASSVVFTVGGVLMGAAPSKEVLLLGRIVAGLGVGLASVVVPVYVAEASPPHIRGRLVSLHQLLINTGIIVSSLLAGGFSYVVPHGWRYMLGMAAVPGLIQFFGFLFMPESPRWLVAKGKMADARAVLSRMRGGADVEDELEEIQVTVLEAERDSAEGIQHILKILRSRHVRRALVVGCGLLFFQQWCGINTVIYYSGSVLKMAGFPVKYAIWLVAVPNLINFLSSFIGIYLVEKIGRRQLLIGSLAGTIVGLVILAVGFQLAASNPATISTSVVETDANGDLISACFSNYKSCEACVKDNSCGYCYSNEMDGSCLPSDNAVHSTAGRCNTSSSTELLFKWAYEFCPSDYTWIALVGMAVFVFAFAPGTFWLFAGITVLGVVFMVFLLPETKDKTLEEVEQLFMNKAELESLAAARSQHEDAKCL